MAGPFIYSDPPVDTILGQEREGFNAFVTSVTDAVGIPLAIVMSPQRDGRVVILRQLLMAVARLELEWTFQRVGTFFGRDHATAVHGVKQVRNRLDVGDWTLWFQKCAIACDTAFQTQYDQPLKSFEKCLTAKKSA